MCPREHLLVPKFFLCILLKFVLHVVNNQFSDKFNDSRKKSEWPIYRISCCYINISTVCWQSDFTLHDSLVLRGHSTVFWTCTHDFQTCCHQVISISYRYASISSTRYYNACNLKKIMRFFQCGIIFCFRFGFLIVVDGTIDFSRKRDLLYQKTI